MQTLIDFCRNNHGVSKQRISVNAISCILNIFENTTIIILLSRGVADGEKIPRLLMKNFFLQNKVEQEGGFLCPSSYLRAKVNKYLGSYKDISGLVHICLGVK